MTSHRAVPGLAFVLAKRLDMRHCDARMSVAIGNPSGHRDMMTDQGRELLLEGRTFRFGSQGVHLIPDLDGDGRSAQDTDLLMRCIQPSNTRLAIPHVTPDGNDFTGHYLLLIGRKTRFLL
ncbi:MAG: hypothetical protein HYZ92_05580 [Candidatus Omnitrophica bacterium]|nr:hypothetical protein [Candidatus Omnitrophota bacterium]